MDGGGMRERAPVFVRRSGGQAAEAALRIDQAIEEGDRAAVRALLERLSGLLRDVDWWARVPEG